jgi:hypothetical protein
MRTLFILNLFINCCYSFISNAPTPHNSNSKTQKYGSSSLTKRPAIARITSCYLKKNNDDDNQKISDLVNQVIYYVIYNTILYYYMIYYIFYSKH